MYSASHEAYNPRKAAQAIALLALWAGGSLNVLKATKLMYLADRESMRRHGFPILDELHVSMPHGPVNSTTYAHINGEVDLDECGWSDFLTARENHMIAVKDGLNDESLDELSDADIACLDTVWTNFGKMTPWEIRDWTHDPAHCPEWEDPEGSSRPIPPEKILRVLGVAEAESQAELIKEHRRLAGLFAALRG